MAKEITELTKSAGRNLNKISNYDFDKRYVCLPSGDVYLIQDETAKHYTVKAMKPFITKDGYVEYVLTDKNGLKKHIQAQRIIGFLYLTKPKGKDYVNHKDGDKQNNHFSNLQWTTQKENVQHTYDKLGRVGKGG
jgi:hypothetical protein